MPQVNETNWDNLVENEELTKAYKLRVKNDIEIKVSNSDFEKYIADGWEVKKTTKRTSTVFKPKPIGDAFEDEVWTVFYKMGFKIMNADNTFSIVYADNRRSKLSRQIDVVAIDDEVILLIECKEASNPNTKQSWDDEINKIANLQGKLFREISEKYPNRKCKHLFVTKNYDVGDADKARLEENGIFYLDQNGIQYYRRLSEQLKEATKYQLLAFVFAKKQIESLKNKVPAIKGSMGKHDYYTFLIEPETLLKIGYILHRTNANNDYDELLPSYQRLIKKERLKEIREFVNNGGYFPNSIIISLDVPKGQKHLTFEPVSKTGLDTDAKMGTLTLPDYYQSAFIIDGQHRLYGYTSSNYSSTNQIPVVAFENLSNDEQLKLFMEINEHQKAVPKALRNILEIDIYKEDANLNKRNQALLGYIGRKLGEDPNSPLYGRVILGEDAGNDFCNLTIENIKNAFKKTDFFNTYKRNGQVEKDGLFKGDTLNEVNSKFYPFFKKLMWSFLDLVNDWNSSDYLITNNGIGMIIRILYDIVSIACADNENETIDTNSLLEKCEDHLLTFADTINNLPPEKKDIIRTTKGTAGLEKPYRVVQMAMHESDSSFTNEAIDSYYIEHGTDYNSEAKRLINEIRFALIEFTKATFNEDNWMSLHLSEAHEKDLTMRINNKQIANTRNGINTQVSVWDEITLEDIQKIIGNGSNWSNNYQEYFSSHGVDSTKVAMIANLKTIYDHEKSIQMDKHITKSQFKNIEELYDKLIGGVE